MVFAVFAFLSSCGDGNDALEGNGSSVESDDNGGGSAATVIEWETPLTLRVKPAVPFTDADVAKPIVMTVSGDNVFGTLTLQNTDGTFAGRITVTGGLSDDAVLTGRVEIPPSVNADANTSVISLDDLKVKCGHNYTAKFTSTSDSIIDLTDDKSYFLFIMSPSQHWLKVNSQKYAMGDDGRVWIAMQSQTPLVTNFYKKPYNEVLPGLVDTIDRAGYVDLGIVNVLWADKNIGADNIEDAGNYYEWLDAKNAVPSPAEMPRSGISEQSDNDVKTLYSSTKRMWGQYNGVNGMFFYVPGCTDCEKDPFLFIPAAGVSQSALYMVGETGMYWTSTQLDASYAYRFNFNKAIFQWDTYIAKNWGRLSVRPILRSNAEQSSEDDPEEMEDVRTMDLMAFFPEGYSKGNVASWYVYKNEDAKEEWALYLFKDNTYLLTQLSARTGARVIQNVGDFSVDGAIDGDYKNFDITATVWRTKRTVQFRDGNCTFMKKNFQQVTKDLPPDPIKCTQDNSNTSILYFDCKDCFEKNTLVAWYMQTETNVDDEGFMAMFIYADGSFDFNKCWIRDGVQSGAKVLEGYLDVNDMSRLDFDNINESITVISHFKYHNVLSIVNGVGTVSGYPDVKLTRQPVSLCYELLGYK